MPSLIQLDRAAAPEAVLRARGLSPYPWSAGPRAVFPAHTHAQTKHLYVLSGTIDFDGIELGAGDGLLIPAGIEHSAIAGPTGVTCLEAFED